MTGMPVRTLLRVHRYAGLTAAPLILFFAISGFWQIYRLHESAKDGSYTAPAIVEKASEAHKAERLGTGPAAFVFKLVAALSATLMVVTTSLGIIVAFRTTRPRWLPLLLLVLGAAVPLLAYLATTGAKPPPRAQPPSQSSSAGQ